MLVLRPGALGDTLLAVPALRALRRRYRPIELAGHGGAAGLLASLGEVDKGLAFDDASLAWLFSEQAHAEAMIVAWMNPDGVPALKQAVVVAPSRPSGPTHCAQYLLETLAPLGVDVRLDERPLNVRPLASDDVLIHAGSGSASKNWPAERFADVIRALARPVRLIVGEADAAVARAVEECFGQALPRLSRLPLEQLAAHLAGCAAYFGNDSGVSHLAGLCGTRSVVLFGPTSPTVWRPLGPNVTIVDFGVSTDRLADALT